MSQKSDLKGTIMMSLAAVLFATGGLALKFVNWNPLVINGIRSLFGLMVIGIYMKVIHHRLQTGPAVWMGAASYALMTTMFVLSNKLTTAANAIVLQYTCPIWIILLSWILYKKLPDRLQTGAVILTGAGILCFFAGSLKTGSIAGDLTALLSGLFYAILFMLNSLKGGDALSSVFWGMGISCLCLSPMAFSQPPLDLTGWFSLIWLGVFQVGAAYVLFCEATKILSPLKASLITGLEPVLNPLLVALVWHEYLSGFALAGAAVVIVTVGGYSLLSIRRQQKSL
ncbi:MAG: EamA family transporter [Erysipelotrichaceae bacterium]|nr:EamA family transporter [Erysipelotrichaceae bacterium]